MQTTYFEITDIYFKYRKAQDYILNGLSFSFSGNSIIGIYGDNGTGKTTFLNCISGVYKIEKGEITLNGKNIEKNRNNIFFIPNESILFPYLTLYDNIIFFMDYFGKSLDKNRFEHFIDRYNLKQQINTYAAQASSGMLKKTLIIIALLFEPQIFIADELFNGLDEKAKSSIIDDIKRYVADNDSIAILSVHNNMFLQSISTEIIDFNTF